MTFRPLNQAPIRTPPPAGNFATQPLGSLEALLKSFLPPGRQKDWPNPRLPAPGSNTQALGRMPEYMGPTVGFPLNQHNWPNPSLPVTTASTQPLGVLPEYIPAAVAASLPFNQYVWPNSSVAKVTPSAQPLGVLPEYMPVAAAALPFNQYNWPNPATQFRPQGTQPLGNLPEYMPAVAVVQLPFNQYNWPNPARLGAGVNTQFLGVATVFIPPFVPPPPVPVVPVVNPYAGFQGGGGGFGSRVWGIPWVQAKAIIERWYNAVGFRWLEEVDLKDLRPSQRMYFMDEVKQSPQVRYLLENGYTMPEVYALINQVKEDSIDDDDGEALSMLLD